MVLGALIDLGLDIDYLKKELDKLDVSGYEIQVKKVGKNSISGTKVDIVSGEKQAHRCLDDINEIIDKSALDSDVKESCKNIFLKLGKAESKVHGIDIQKVHFHEVGALDTILDIVGIAVGLKKLDIKKVFSSRLHIGSGFVKCAHGTIPVPAPATAELIKGIPVYSTGVLGELVTPTGAAVITYLTTDFGKMPHMRVDKVGYGAGKAELEHPNLLRIFLGELVSDYDTDTVNVIETNIDDMNPEYYEHLIEKLLAKGALDAFLANIQMKNSRPAIKVSVICTPENTDKLAEIIFNETTTFGVRIFEAKRKKLFTEKKEVQTKYGTVSVKSGSTNSGIKTMSPEYRDCKKIADENNIPLKEIYELAKAAAKSSDNKQSLV